MQQFHLATVLSERWEISSCDRWWFFLTVGDDDAVVFSRKWVLWTRHRGGRMHCTGLYLANNDTTAINLLITSALVCTNLPASLHLGFHHGIIQVSVGICRIINCLRWLCSKLRHRSSCKNPVLLTSHLFFFFFFFFTNNAVVADRYSAA